MERKNLNTLSLIDLLRHEFRAIKDPLIGKSKYSLVDCLSSGLAIFGMKTPSLLQFDEFCRSASCNIKYNIQHLYGVKHVPSDTYFRERLDSIDEIGRLQYGVDKIIARLQHGKVLEDYKYLEDGYLVAIDGTGYFSSHEVHCANCCEKHHRDGSITYQHQILSAVLMHPDMKTVFPLALEPIVKQDGAVKNDCESNACIRLLRQLKKAHHKLKLILVMDALYANATIIKLIQELGWSYIITAKNVDYLFEQFNYGGKKIVVSRNAGKINQEWGFAANLSLNEAHPEVKVNVVEYTEINLTKAKNGYHSSWVTNLMVTKERVMAIARGGRSRWHIENETYNTLKNQGYHFGHNYGHGQNKLSTVMAYLMFLAFLIDQVQEATNQEFQQALKKMKRKRYLWERFKSVFTEFMIDSWNQLYAFIINKDGRFNRVLSIANLEKLVT